MDSFYSSTTSMQTPSPLDKNTYKNPYRSSRDFNNKSKSQVDPFSTPASQPFTTSNSSKASPASLYPSLNNTPFDNHGNADASTSNLGGGGGTGIKSVRFNSTQSPQYNSSSPPTRLVGTPPGRVTSTPSSSSALAKPSSLGRYPVLNSSSASRPRQSTPSLQSRKEAVEVKKVVKSDLLPLGRGEIANRLRVNSVLLVIFWISSRSDVYGSASAMLSQAIPALDTPLQFLQKSVLLILFFNIADSMYKLQNLSSLPPPVRTRRTSSSKTSPTRTLAGSPYSNNTFGTPLARSSPKTRPAPSMSPSPSLARTSSSTQAPTLSTPSPSQISPFKPTRITPSSFQSQNQNQPSSATTTKTTPNAESRRISNPLRRSLLGSVTGPNAIGSPTGTGESSGSGVGVAASALVGYLARHSNSSNVVRFTGNSPSRGVTSREEIDRLFD